MTINELVSIFQLLLKDYTQETKYTAPALWKLFTLHKSKLIKRRLDNFKKVSDSNYITVCLETESSVSHVCSCVTHGCNVKKTKFALPSYLTKRSNDTLVVRDLQGRTIDRFKEEDYKEIKLDEIKKDLPKYDIVNNHIILFDCEYSKIQVKAIWGDVLELNTIKCCEDNNCPDYSNTTIDTDYDLFSDALEMTLRLLNLPLSLVDDITNDVQPEIKK